VIVPTLDEATHGTHEFDRERAFITRRLITEKGFAASAVEADWPDAYRINRYVRESAPTKKPSRRSQISAGSRPGCGATPTSSTSSAEKFPGRADFSARRSTESGPVSREREGKLRAPGGLDRPGITATARRRRVCDEQGNHDD
jgi:Erythromycin esterase